MTNHPMFNVFKHFEDPLKIIRSLFSLKKVAPRQKTERIVLPQHKTDSTDIPTPPKKQQTTQQIKHNFLLPPSKTQV